MYSSLKTSSILQGFPKYRSNLVGNAAYDPAGFVSIATVTATGGETSLTFSNIPQGYASLQIRGLVRSAVPSAAPNYGWGLRINNNTTAANYKTHTLDGTGSVAYAEAISGYDFMYLNYAPADATDAGLFGAVIIDIHDYAKAAANKTVRAFQGVDTNGGGGLSIRSGGFFVATNVTRLDLIDIQGYGFAAGTKFALYGIKGAA